MLTLRNLTTERKLTFENVEQFWICGNGTALVLKTSLETTKEKKKTLKWVTLPSGTAKSFWNGSNAGNLIFDESGTQLAFSVEHSKNNQIEKSFWYCKKEMVQAVLLADKHSTGIDAHLHLENIYRFSNDGKRLFINLKEHDFLKATLDAVKVDVWSYQDAKLQSEQLSDLSFNIHYLSKNAGPRTYLAVVKLNDERIIRLQQDSDKRIDFTS